MATPSADGSLRYWWSLLRLMCWLCGVIGARCLKLSGAQRGTRCWVLLLPQAPQPSSGTSANKSTTTVPCVRRDLAMARCPLCGGEVILSEFRSDVARTSPVRVRFCPRCDGPPTSKKTKKEQA